MKSQVTARLDTSKAMAFRNLDRHGSMCGISTSSLAHLVSSAAGYDPVATETDLQQLLTQSLAQRASPCFSAAQDLTGTALHRSSLDRKLGLCYASLGLADRRARHLSTAAFEARFDGS